IIQSSSIRHASCLKASTGLTVTGAGLWGTAVGSLIDPSGANYVAGADLARPTHPIACKDRTRAQVGSSDWIATSALYRFGTTQATRIRQPTAIASPHPLPTAFGGPSGRPSPTRGPSRGHEGRAGLLGAGNGIRLATMMAAVRMLTMRRPPPHRSLRAVL